MARFRRGGHTAASVRPSAFATQATVIYYCVLRVVGLYKPPENDPLPSIEKFKVALAAVSAIGFMQLSLLTCPITFYQIFKNMTIPLTICINYYVYAIKTSGHIILSLSILLLGVVITSGAGASGGGLNIIGFTFSCLAVVTTSVYRIWQVPLEPRKEGPHGPWAKSLTPVRHWAERRGSSHRAPPDRRARSRRSLASPRTRSWRAPPGGRPCRASSSRSARSSSAGATRTRSARRW